MKILQLILAIFCCAAVAAQDAPPFYEEIQTFKKQDSASFPPKNAILFVGSSSFTFWTDVQDYFPGYTIINRGFGGSTLQDVIRYAPDIITPYKPKQVVIYCGENDLAYDDSVTPWQVLQRFKTLFTIIRKAYPAVPVAYVSMKPSPSRKHLLLKMTEANLYIETFLKKQKQAVFIDVYHSMVDTKGEPLPQIFIEDNLHMNAAGYRIWQLLIQPHLLNTP
ncbi:MAG TPA: GDSL-type esterase/lipase family protein [Ferruginibacter sp.]|nr:GDSL-type esterase/lipase family protein [Ferruginibacter sp.]HMP20018.1 GDSL-type esterase/lipase family protein [Ferruginibacter sp.]